MLPRTLSIRHRRESGDNDNATRAQELLRAANDAAGVARNLYLALLGAALFIAIVTGGLTDEKLLRDGSVPLPLIEKPDLPFSKFYLIAPWLIVFVHAELLMHLAMLADKLRMFGNALAGMKEAEAKRLRCQLANFPFSHWLAQLQGADLHYAQLQGADLKQAQFQGANLSEAELQGADLFEAQLQGANLSQAQLQGASLWQAQLQGAQPS